MHSITAFTEWTGKPKHRAFPSHEQSLLVATGLKISAANLAY